MNLPFIFKISLISTVLVYPAFSYAEELTEGQVKKICDQAVKTPVPASDQPSVAVSQSLKKCNPTNLYYGIQQPADWVKARQCAYAVRDYPTLTMIYANGKGTPRNWDLALHFACQSGFAPEETVSRVAHLIELRNKNWQGADFDICDDITSGYMMGVCASRKEQQAQAKRQSQLTALMSSWSDADKQAWQNLQLAANNFFTAHSAYEVDLSGTARAALEIEERETLEDDLVKSLQDLTQGQLPAYSAEAAAKVDEQLNEVYQEIEKNNDFSIGTIDRAGIKKTQLVWLKYRDAWIAFGKIKYPQVDENAWKAWLAEKRVKMLQDLTE